MMMRTYKQRLTLTGWLGAILFVAPLPTAHFMLMRATTESATEARYRAALESVTGQMMDGGGFSPLPFVVLGMLSMIGLVMVIVGRETVSYG